MNSTEYMPILNSEGLIRCKTRTVSRTLGFTISEECMKALDLKDRDTVVVRMKRISDGQTTGSFETMGRTSFAHQSANHKMYFRIPRDVYRDKDIGSGQFFYCQVRKLDIRSWFESEDEVPLHAYKGSKRGDINNDMTREVTRSMVACGLYSGAECFLERLGEDMP